MKHIFYRFSGLIFALIMLFSFSNLQCLAEPTTLVVANYSVREEYRKYATSNGIKVVAAPLEGNAMDVIATAYAIQDDRVDIYEFSSSSGLYLIKEKNFYVPLENSEIIQQEYQNLYPAFQKALSDDGHIAGWLCSASPVAMWADLTEFGLEMPQTFDEFLDACKYLHENDLLGTKYRIADTYKYTQASMLGYYMEQYIMAFYAQGNVPDFTRKEFLATVERIRNEVPAELPLGFNSDEKLPIFYLAVIDQYITKLMLPHPRVLEEQPNAIETICTIAVVNPFSKNKEAATAMLEYLAQNPANIETSHFYDTTELTLIENKSAMTTLNSLKNELSKYQQKETLTQEEKDRMAQLQDVLIPEYEEKCYWVGPDEIAYYREFAQNLYVNEGSPVSYDAQLRQYASQYLSGLMTLEQFSQKCQSHIERIFKELQ